MSKLIPSGERVLSEEEEDKFKTVVAELVYGGRTPAEIAKALHEDKNEQKRLRQHIRRMARNDPEFQRKVAERAHGEMVMSLGTITRALIRRAQRGRPDAIKLLFEATGFHNPRVKHEHSGDIKITLNIPRPELREGPKKVENVVEEPVVDAEVVEEDQSTGNSLQTTEKA